MLRSRSIERHRRYMERNVEYKGLEPDGKIEKLIDRLVAKLERTASRFSPTHLRLFVEYVPARTLYEVSLTFDVPGKTLAAKEEQHDLTAGLRAALEEIERQLTKHKESLRREHRKRPARRKEVREMETRAAPIEENKRETFFSLVTPHLSRLNHFVRHVISYAEAIGDLLEGELAPEDVVDGALVRAYRDFAKGHSIPDVKSWLVRFALDQLEAEVRLLKTEHAGTVSLEEPVPETPPAQEVSTLGEETLDFYQPDEALKVEDLVPDIETTTPEAETENQELRRVVTKALREMPSHWRQTLLQHDLQNRSRADIAKESGKPESEVDRIVQSAREYLRQRLVSSGFDFKKTERAA
jgi:RNA polymerase sigma factor (sigma-70 family)